MKGRTYMIGAPGTAFGKKRYVQFCCRGERFVVNEKGEMTQAERFFRNHNDFSGGWRLLGVSHHHWRRSPDARFDRIWEDPKLMNGGLVWDRDHGTTRQWGGSYCGKLPRAWGAFAFEA